MTKILLVEDNPDHVLLMKGALTRNGEFTVTVVQDGEEALQELEHHDYELVLADYRLPRKNGLELLREIKKRNVTAPLVLVTGQGDEKLASEALKEGAYDYVIKAPNYFEELPHIARHVLERRRLEKRLAELAVKDELTQVHNHRYFQERLIEEFNRAQRYKRALSCAMMDIDFFKTINDKYGHQFGDFVLKELALLLSQKLRQSDILARYGGEEFVFLLPETPAGNAMGFAQRIRNEVIERAFENETAKVKVTISIGLSSFPEDHITRKDQLVEFADRALYRAKGSGRDRVCSYGQAMEAFQKEIPKIQVNEDKLSEIRDRIYDLSEKVKRAYIEATRALVYALEAKDPYVKEHSQQVGKYSYLVAKKLGMSMEECVMIEHAGLLHDIGKVCISDEILLKPGRLTHEEYELMKEHAILGYKIIQPIKYLRDELPIILYHHEWYNGQGYPHGLKGTDIPLGARVVGAVDAFVTMMDTSRLYQNVKSKEETTQEMVRFAGTQFDPVVVKALAETLVEHREIPPGCYDKSKLETLVAEASQSAEKEG